MRDSNRLATGNNKINRKMFNLHKTLIAFHQSIVIIIIVIIIIILITRKRVYNKFIAVARVYINNNIIHNPCRLVKIDQLRINRWRPPINRPSLRTHGKVVAGTKRYLLVGQYIIQCQQNIIIYTLVDLTRCAHVSADAQGVCGSPIIIIVHAHDYTP